MIPVLSREQMRSFDQHAIESCHVPGILLMENAGRGAASIILRALDEGTPRLVIVAGPGNNGGDGFVVARRLAVRGRRVEVFLIGTLDRLKGDARVNYDAWVGLGGAVHEVADDNDLAALEGALAGADAVIDALFGTGLDRPIEGRMREIVDAINACPARKFALDVPSGLDSNTGSVLGAAVRAELTVTFAHLKLGLVTPNGVDHAGDVHVVDVGVPPELHTVIGCSAWIVETHDVAAAIAPRKVSAHKSSAGHVFAIAGSAGKTGAALLVARGAMRAGAGLTTICTFPDAADALDRRVLEEMTQRIDPANVEKSLDDTLSGAKVVAIGPGFGLGAEARRVVDHVVLGWDGVIVVDADAITHFADRGKELASARGKLVLTPHPGELGRLLGISTSEVEADRFAALARAVDLTGAVVLLKGARTLIGAPTEHPIVNVAGTPALATAGTGDVLTGIIAAFAASLEPRIAAYCGAHVHALAAERWTERTPADRGLVAHEIADRVPEVLALLSGAEVRMPV